MGKKKRRKQPTLNFDYVFWDKDGTMVDYKNPQKIYRGLKEILMRIPSEKQGLITNCVLPKLFLKSQNILKYFNPNLIMSAEDEIDKIITNPGHPFRKLIKLSGIYMEDNLKIEEYIKKPSTYMFKEVMKREKMNPSNCVMIGDSFEDIIAAQCSGFKTIYMNGLEKENNQSKDKKYSANVHDMKLEPDYRIHVGDTKALEKILFG